MGKRGCGSKPFASRLCRFPVVFVAVLNLSDFGRRLAVSRTLVGGLFSLSDFGRRSVAFVSCITIRLLSLSDFGRRPCFPDSRFSVIFVCCITIRPLSLSDFGRRLCMMVICFFSVPGALILSLFDLFSHPRDVCF